jgi:hypothetical protein
MTFFFFFSHWGIVAIMEEWLYALHGSEQMDGYLKWMDDE